jgi:hypothetical protein
LPLKSRDELVEPHSFSMPSGFEWQRRSNCISLEVGVAGLEKDALCRTDIALAVVAVVLEGRVDARLAEVHVLQVHQLLAHAVVELRSALHVLRQGTVLESLCLRQVLVENGALLAPLR